MFTLAELADRFANEFVMLATLSFRIIVDAEVRTSCSLLDRFVMPGNGRICRLQTSESWASRRARSPRGGAKIGILELVVKRDCDRLSGESGAVLVDSLIVMVFFTMT